MQDSTHETGKSGIEVTVLERKVVNPQSAISKYKVGKLVVAVESLFSSAKTYHDLLFQIIKNKLQR